MAHCRTLSAVTEGGLLNKAEREKAKDTLSKREFAYNFEDDLDLLHGLDIGEKFDALLRSRSSLPTALSEYLLSKKSGFDKCIAVRNSVMHGRPLTIDEYALGFALASDLLKTPRYWPNLFEVTKKYKDDPKSVIEGSAKLLEQFDFPEVLNNLPAPDYEDTGFFPRPRIEKELKKKILGRHPVITVLGDGGNGKSAVTLQTLYGLLAGNDHDFDAIIWVSAKSSKLTVGEIERIEGAITTSLDAFGAVARFMHEETETPIERVRSLLENNKILLVIDNLETILDKTLVDFASDVPGESKLLLTSRVPLGSDLTVVVDPFEPKESVAFLRNLASAYDISALKRKGQETLMQYAVKLNYRPLLLKWFALGVLSGLDPSSIVRNSDVALKFVLENVFERLTEKARRILRVLAALPRPASIAVLIHVTDESTDDIEAAISELMRFTIVEQDASTAYEIEYRVKPIAKAFMVRVLGEKLKDLDQVLFRYRRLEAIYQDERSGGALDRYNPRQFVVRSQSEALAVRKLRRAVQLALKLDFEHAIQLVDDLKRSHPDYFEVFRVEAFVSVKMGDLPKAQLAYEAALELDEGNSHPQLYHFFGGFLLRSFNDYIGALKYFAEALIIDPEALPPLVEAARARMFLHEFDEAQLLISRGMESGASNLRSEIILYDLQLQNYGRRFDIAIAGGNARECIKYLGDFSSFLSEISFEHLDEVLLNHLRQYQKVVWRLKEALGTSATQELEALEKSFNEILCLAPGLEKGVEVDSGDDDLAQAKCRRIGKLKREGLKPNFGFIRDETGADTFVAKSTVSPQLWQSMVNGSTVVFDVAVNEEGKTRAVKINLLK